MLSELHITNLALIERLSLSFSHGLSVLTGETGAGKSIILQAIHLLSGGKASSTWIRSGAEQAVIEALFEVSPEHSQIIDKLCRHGFECDESIILKRTLSGKGRSRFYINGGLATAKLTSEVAENLLSVASQHDHQQLLSSHYHLDFIDAVGGLWSERDDFSSQYDIRQSKKSEYDTLLKKEMEKEQRKDFLNFQVSEINEARISPGEDEKLNQEKIRLKGSDDLIRLGKKSYSLLYSATDPLAQLRKNIEQMVDVDTSLSSLSEEIAGASFQLEDQLVILKDYLESVPNDPHELDKVMARLDILQQLKRKYGPELDDVINYGRMASRELSEIEALDKKLETLQKELESLEKSLLKSADALSRKRKKTAETLTETIKKELHTLCLDQAMFDIHFAETTLSIPALNRKGLDKPSFIFSANPGEPLKPVAQIASGGELSRLLLALKCLLARKDQVETVIFDEIDAGISGKAAESVARKIKELAGHHQVICITHLPQIASFASDHYRVSKSTENERTQSAIVQLSDEQRIMELAGMLDGNSITPQTVAYVTELISRNQSL